MKKKIGSFDVDQETGHNGASKTIDSDEQPDIHDIVGAMRAIQITEKPLTSFYGSVEEDAYNFLHQFEIVEGSWPDTKILKSVKLNLKGLARKWYLALEGEEIVSYMDFKKYFAKRFIKERNNQEKEVVFFKKLFQGPLDNDLLSFAYNLKELFKGLNKDIFIIKTELKKLVSPIIGLEIEKADNWMEILEVIEKNEDKIKKKKKKKSVY